MSISSCGLEIPLLLKFSFPEQKAFEKIKNFVDSLYDYKYSGVTNPYFFVDENWICAMIRHHAEPNINILLTRNFPFDSDVSEAIPSWHHAIFCGLNRTIERVVNLNATWLGFVFVLISFLQMHGAVVVPYFLYIFKLCKKAPNK